MLNAHTPLHTQHFNQPMEQWHGPLKLFHAFPRICADSGPCRLRFSCSQFHKSGLQGQPLLLWLSPFTCWWIHRTFLLFNLCQLIPASWKCREEFCHCPDTALWAQPSLEKSSNLPLKVPKTFSPSPLWSWIHELLNLIGPLGAHFPMIAKSLGTSWFAAFSPITYCQFISLIQEKKWFVNTVGTFFCLVSFT